MLNSVIRSMRPKQWYKNILIFVGIIFSNNALSFSLWPKVILAFIIFCLASGSEYIINDLIDRKADSLHPIKKNRPIASGQLSPAIAASLAVVLIVAALAASYFIINTAFFLIITAYVALMLLYSTVLKKLVIIDVFVIALGFVIRAIAGCLVIDVSVSYWLIICTFMIALFLVFEKRWSELQVLKVSADLHRQTLSGYSTGLLDLFIVIVTGVTITAYIMYCTYINNFVMFFTAILAMYGIFRFLYLVHFKGVDADPWVIFIHDIPSLINIILWGLSFFIILYSGGLRH